MSNDITALPQRMKAAALKAKSEANEWGYDTDAFHDEATPDAVIQVVEDLEASRAENKLWALEVTKRNGEIYGLEQRIAELESRTVTVKRVGADQMHRVCLEATRHLDKYAAMAREVNKLLGSAVTNTTAAQPVTVKLPKRSVGEVMHMSGFSRDYAEGWCSGNDNAIN